MIAKSSVQWAASVASVFWGVWWTSFVKEIADSNIQSMDIPSMNTPWITISKNHLLVILVFWGVLFAVVFVRWLARAQYWGAETGVGHWINNSRFVILLIVTLLLAIRSLQLTFSLKGEIITYGITLAILWPIAPFVVAIWPEERR